MGKPTIISVSAFLVLFFFIFLSVCRVDGQTIPAGVCAPLASNSLCNDILSPSYTASVFIAQVGNIPLNTSSPSSNCQQAQESIITSQAALLFAALASPLSPSTCQTTFAKYFCSYVYPSCVNTKIGSATVAVPLQPCSVDAENLQTQCGGARSPAYELLTAFVGTQINSSALLNVTSGKCLPQDSYVPVSIPQPSCNTYSGGFCSGVVNYPVYLPAALKANAVSVALLEAELESSSFLYRLAPTATNCPSALKKHLCSRVMLQCNNQVLLNALNSIQPLVPTVYQSQFAQFQQLANAFPIPFPAFPCRSTCNYFSEASCPGLLSAIPASSLSALGANCSSAGFYVPAASVCGTNPTAALADYPSGVYTIANLPLPAPYNALLPSGLPLEVMCNNVNITENMTIAATSLSAYIDSSPQQIAISCPAPLVSPDSPTCAINGGSCATPCPLPTFTPAEYLMNNRAFDAWVIISFVGTSIFLATWLTFAERRKQIYVVAFAFSTWLLSLLQLTSFGQTPWNQLVQIGCKNNCEANGWGDSAYCGFNGVYTHFLPFTIATWWTLLSADIWSKVRLSVKLTAQQTRLKHIAFFSFAYSYPFITVMIAIGRGDFGGMGYLPWCFYTQNSGDDDLNLFYWPVLSLLCVGFACLFDVLYVLSKHSWAMRGTASGITRKRGAYKAHLRTLIFLGEFLIILIFVLSNRLYLRDHQNDIVAITETWVACLLGPGGSQAVCGTVPSTSNPNRGLFYGIALAVGGQGMFFSLTHITQKGVWKLWYKLIWLKQISLISRSTTGAGDSSSTAGKDVEPSRPGMPPRQKSGIQLSTVPNTPRRPPSLGSPLSSPLGSSGDLGITATDFRPRDFSTVTTGQMPANYNSGERFSSVDQATHRASASPRINRTEQQR